MAENGNGSKDPVLENSTIKSLLHKIVDFSHSESTGVINFIQPEPLEQVLTEKLEKAIQSAETNSPVGDNLKEMEALAEYCMNYSVNTSHPHFLNQLYAGVHPMGLAATYILEKMNTNA